MLEINDSTKKALLDLFNEKNICLEGNVLKVINIKNEENKEFSKYIKNCIERDKNSREKRLRVTKQVQKLNVELEKNKKEIETQVIGSAWSNMFGILLTNAFSIIGTIMGVKYANGKK